MNVKDIRRVNLRTLAKQAGGVSALARRIGKAQTQISHVIGFNPVKNIGDKFAAIVEQAFDLPYGWLDKQHVTDVANAEQIQPLNSKITWVPVLQWKQAGDLPHITPATLDPNREHIPAMMNLGVGSFALRLLDNGMEASTGSSFPARTLVIFDPNYHFQPDDFVLAIRDGTHLVFRQIIHENYLQYLKPLNPQYPLVEFTAKNKIVAVARMAINYLTPSPTPFISEDLKSFTPTLTNPS